MGDVGSQFQGLVMGVVVLELHRSGQVPLVASLILLGGFWIDASYTLCVRMLTGQEFTRPYRSHLYQRVADRLGHGRATTLFGLVGVFWLLPLAAGPFLAGAAALGAGRAPGAESRKGAGHRKKGSVRTVKE